MSLTQFEYNHDLFSQFKKNEVSKENKERAIKYLLTDQYMALELLKEKTWETEDNKQRLIRRVIRESSTAYTMLTSSQLLELMNKDQIRSAIENCIEKPKYAALLASSKLLDEEQFQEAVQTALLNRGSTMDLLANAAVPIDVRQQVFDQLKDSESFIKNCIYYGRKVPDDTIRRQAFDKLFETFSPYTWFGFAKDNKLHKSELKIIYDKYHSEFHNKYKFTFYEYYSFCKAFNPFLHDEYRERMAKKLMSVNYWTHRHHVCEDVTFSESIKEKLQAYELLVKFQKLNGK